MLDKLKGLRDRFDELNDQFHVDTEALDTPIRLVTATPKFELSLEGSLAESPEAVEADALEQCTCFGLLARS